MKIYALRTVWYVILQEPLKFSDPESAHIRKGVQRVLRVSVLRRHFLLHPNPTIPEHCI